MSKMLKYINWMKVLFENWIITGLNRKGLSHQSHPGILFSNGPTWKEMRRTSLQTLKDFGFGKSILEDIVEEEIDNLLEHIDKHYLNQPVNIIRSLELQEHITFLVRIRFKYCYHIQKDLQIVCSHFFGIFWPIYILIHDFKL